MTLLATAVVQKERRPSQPTNGSPAISNTSSGAVTLSWSPGPALLGSNPHHYEVVIGSLYADRNVAQGEDPTTHRITNARSQGLEGTHTARVSHCNAAGGCSLPTSITFTLPPFVRPPPPPPTAVPLPAPTNLVVERDPNDSNRESVRVTFNRSGSSPHYYNIELEQRSTRPSSTTPFSASLTSDINDNTSPVSFADVDQGDWYRARGQKCRDVNRNNCGSWSSVSAAFQLPLEPPTITGIDGDPSAAEVEVDYDLSGTKQHFYKFEIHQSDSRLGAYTLSDSKNSGDSPSLVVFDALDGDKWYRARGQKCGGASRNNCGDWSAWSSRLLLRNFFQFVPDPLTPGHNSSNTWSVPADVSNVHIAMVFSTGTTKDAGAGMIRVQVTTPGSAQQEYTFHNTGDNQSIATPAGTTIAVSIDADAFDQQNADVTLRFHEGTGSGGDVLAEANFDKEARPPRPINDNANVDPQTTDVELTWDEGPDVANDNPDHYRVTITPDGSSQPVTGYDQRIVFATMLKITNARANGIVGKHNVEVRHCNVRGGCSAALRFSFTVIAKLTAPEITDVVPMFGRQAVLKWTAVPNADRYSVRVYGTRPESIPVDSPGGLVTEHPLDLDLYLYDINADTFEVVAQDTTGTFMDSDPSPMVQIIDSPITRVDGNSKGAIGGRATVSWDVPITATEYEVWYLKVAEQDSHGHDSWRPDYSGIWDDVDPGPAVGDSSIKIAGLTKRAIYAVRMNYTNNGMVVFAGRAAYVWPSTRQPTADERLANFPYFGHWPNKTYTYRICEGTFPSSERSEWEALIRRAAGEWQSAMDDFVKLTEDNDMMMPCDMRTEVLPGKNPFMAPIMLTMAQNHVDVSEIHMVDDTAVFLSNLAVSIPILEGFLEDIEGLCVLSPFTGGCTVSRAYGSDAQAATSLAHTSNAVDILVRKGQFYRPDGTLDTRFGVNVPNTTYFNYCQPVRGTSAYQLMLHEFGHALGTSGFEFSNLIGFLPGVTSLYEEAHPRVPEAVMNYDGKVAEIEVGGEPDCSPHPLDIMALWALYQTVGNVGGGEK